MKQPFFILRSSESWGRHLNWGKHQRNYFTIAWCISNPEAMSGWLSSGASSFGYVSQNHKTAKSSLWPANSGSLSLVENLFSSPYWPFVLKMGRPFNHLNGVLIMLHLISGLNFWISIPPSQEDSWPWKIDSLLTKTFLSSWERWEKYPGLDEKSTCYIFPQGEMPPPNWFA